MDCLHRWYRTSRDFVARLTSLRFQIKKLSHVNVILCGNKLYNYCYSRHSESKGKEFGKELFIRFTASAFRKLPSVYVFSYFLFGFEGRMWDLIVSVPDHCLSFLLYYARKIIKT